MAIAYLGTETFNSESTTTCSGTLTVPASTDFVVFSIGMRNFSAAAPPSSVTIDGAHAHRTLFHLAVGTLTVKNLTLANGEGGYAGGCIRSFGNVALIRSVVANCSVCSNGTGAFRGGAIYASGNVSLYRSTISGNTITKKAVDATFSRGGGVFAKGNFYAGYSSTATITS